MIICSTPTGEGYIIVAPDGAVFTFGDAVYKGGANTGHLSPGDRITGAACAADGSGYWLVAESGAVYAYGPSYFGRVESPEIRPPGGAGVLDRLRRR